MFAVAASSRAALADHVLWCAEQALTVWNQHRPGDSRPWTALNLYREHLRHPENMPALIAAIRASDVCYDLADEVTSESCDHEHVALALAHAARTVAACVSSAADGTVLRTVRLFAAMAHANLAAHKIATMGAAPAEIAAVEAETMEAIQHQQDVDLRQRLR
jgi:hypothetical protein